MYKLSIIIAPIDGDPFVAVGDAAGEIALSIALSHLHHNTSKVSAWEPCIAGVQGEEKP